MSSSSDWSEVPTTSQPTRLLRLPVVPFPSSAGVGGEGGRTQFRDSIRRLCFLLLLRGEVGGVGAGGEWWRTDRDEPVDNAPSLLRALALRSSLSLSPLPPSFLSTTKKKPIKYPRYPSPPVFLLSDPLTLFTVVSPLSRRSRKTARSTT